MESKSLLRSTGRDWFLDDLIPEETTNSQGVPVKLKPLNLRQTIFAKEYAIELDCKKAAEKARITSGTGWKWLKQLNVRRAIQLIIQNRLKTAEMDAMWVLSNTREVVERCMDPANFQPGYALKGLEMVGKNFGMFADRSIVDVNQKTVIRIESNLPEIVIS